MGKKRIIGRRGLRRRKGIRGRWGQFLTKCAWRRGWTLFPKGNVNPFIQPKGKQALMVRRRENFTPPWGSKFAHRGEIKTGLWPTHTSIHKKWLSRNDRIPALQAAAPSSRTSVELVGLPAVGRLAAPPMTMVAMEVPPALAGIRAHRWALRPGGQCFDFKMFSPNFPAKIWTFLTLHNYFKLYR
jgi:hypothetical protein